MYQPSSNEIEKLEWLENFENLLVDAYLKQKSVFIVTGNFNIDLLGDLKESILRYKNLLYTFSLHQHITKATWKNKTLDTPYRIFNIKKNAVNLVTKMSKMTSKQMTMLLLLTSIVFGLDDANYQIATFNPLSANFTKWSNTLKQFTSHLPTKCLSVFDHFVGLVLKGLTVNNWLHRWPCSHFKKSNLHIH